MPSHRKLSSDLHRGKPLFIRLRAEESRRLSALARAYRVTKVEFLRRLLATTRDPEGVEQFVAVCRLCRRVSWPAMAETCPTCVQPTLEGQRICCRACDLFVPADDLARHSALASHLANMQRKRDYPPTPEAAPSAAQTPKLKGRGVAVIAKRDASV